jgi:hypothetical protein
MKLLLAAALALAVLWILAPWDSRMPEPEDLAGTATAPPSGPRTVPALALSTDDERRAERAPVAVAAPEGLALRGRLRGTVPTARWTAALALHIKGLVARERRRARLEVPVAGDGSFEVRLPDWTRSCDEFELRVIAEDPWHLPLDARFGAEARASDTLDLDVVPIGIVAGTVVDDSGSGVPAARIAALEMRRERGDLSDPRATVNTDAEGAFVLRVPLEAELLLVAVPMREASISGLRLTGHEGAITDSNQTRDDLLPASAIVRTALGTRVELAALRLASPAPVSGSVLWQDGSPVPGVGVVWMPQDATTTVWIVERNLGRWDDGGTAWAGRTTTDERGRFAVPVAPGRPGVCFLVDGAGRNHALVAPARAVGPADLTFRLVGRTTIRVSEGDRRIAEARVTIDVPRGRLQPLRTDAAGEVHLLHGTSAACDVEIEVPGHRRVVRTVPAPSADGALVTIALELRPMATARIMLAGADELRRLRFLFERFDTDEPLLPLVVERRRERPDEPFVFELPLGRYRVTLQAAAGAPQQETITESRTFELAVGPGGADLSVPIDAGGRSR